MSGGIYENADEFADGDFADDFGVDPLDGFEFAGPVGGIVGPAEPGGFVGRPFGRHRETLRGGRWREGGAALAWRRFGASRFFVEETLLDSLIGVDAAIAEEGPVAADIFEMGEIDFAVQNFFSIGGGFGDDYALRIAEE